MADPHGGLDWHFAYWNEQFGEALYQQLSLADTILLGKRTYLAMANYWKGTDHELSLSRADLMLSRLLTEKQKAVITNQRLASPWQNTVFLDSDLCDAMEYLKSQPGRDVVLLGSRKLLTALSALDLIDRYQLFFHPLAIGHGQGVFDALLRKQTFQLADLTTCNSQVVQLSYQRIRF